MCRAVLQGRSVSPSGAEPLACRSVYVLGRALDSYGLHFPYADPVELFLLLLGFVFILFIYFGCWTAGGARVSLWLRLV